MMPRRGFEPTSSLRSKHSSTSGDRIDGTRTDPRSRFWSISAADAALGPMGAGFEPFCSPMGGTISQLLPHLESP